MVLHLLVISCLKKRYSVLIAGTTLKGEIEMKTAIIIGVVWSLVSVICLWINYRFHRSRIINNNQDFVFEIPIERGSNKSAVASIV